MSTSPSFNGRPIPTSTIGTEHGIYAPPPQNVHPGMQPSHQDPRMDYRASSQPQPQGFYSHPPPQQSQSLVHQSQSQIYAPTNGYAPLPRPADMSMPHQGAYQYPPRQQPPIISPQNQMPQNMMTLPPDTAPMFPTYPPPPSSKESYPEVPPQFSTALPDKQITTAIDSNREQSPKPQRKAKGHVAAACMPCKRAHLKCDSARPCSRCCSTGKEDSCIDTQHKKRGRPRLRDDREARYDTTSQPYPQPINPNTRGLVPMGANRRPPEVISPMGHPGNMSQSYPRPLPFNGEIPCAYLNLDLTIERASRPLSEMTGIQELAGQRLFDLVAPDDRQRLYRLQTDFQHERQQRDSGYLPPIYPQDRDRERIIHSLSMSAEEMSNFRLDRQETLSFQAPGSYSIRRHPVLIGLEKFETSYFIVLVIPLPHVQPDMRMVYPQNPHMQQVPSYGNNSPQQGDFGSRTGSFGSYGGMPFDPRLRDQQLPVQQGSYVGGGPYDRPNNNMPHQLQQQPQAMAPSYAQPFPSPSYPMQQMREPPRSHAPPNQPQPPPPPPPARSNEYQLPPIRAAGGPTASPRRVDIEELLEGPQAKRERR